MPSIVSADGLLGCEADTVVCMLAFTYAEKLTNYTQWFVALYSITLALPFFAPPTAVFVDPKFSQGAALVLPILNGWVVQA